MSTINCFVSFSGTDGNERDIQFLIARLKEKLGDKVNFKAYFDLRGGTDLQDFMKRDLLGAEAVIALFTPDYKRKADDHISSGVLTEFSVIVDRLEGRTTSAVPSMLFIPIYWRGTDFGAALPSLIANRHFTRDLRKFHAYGGDAPYLPQSVESELRPTLDRVVEDLTHRWREADPRYAAIKTEVEHALLDPTVQVDDAFFRKAERTSLTLDEFSDKLFVKTSAYKAIKQYHNMAFTGRKGAGKTTLVKIYRHRNAHLYFEPIDIEVNDWNLHYLFDDLTFKSKESDFHYTEEESKIFDYVWPVFLALCMVRSVSTSSSIPVRMLVSDPDRARRIEASERYDSLFSLAIEIVADFMQNTIDRASTKSEGEFKSDLLLRLNVRNCAEFLLGPGYDRLIAAIRSDPQHRRFLFCLDRFDTDIQKFRKDLKLGRLSEEERERHENREVFWLQGLVEMIDHLRNPDMMSLDQEYYRYFGPFVDFCVPLPRDRLYEVQLRRRDAVVGDIKEEISWRPIELLTMLRKRLQLLWRIDDHALDRAAFPRGRPRFDRIVELSGRKLPAVVNVRIGSAKYPVDLFLNVLRHTFFRPRDIIIFYAGILVAVESAARKRQTLSEPAIAKLISDLTYRIVEDEFLGEFTDTLPDFRNVIETFRAGPQILSLADVSARIGPSP